MAELLHYSSDTDESLDGEMPNVAPKAVESEKYRSDALRVKVLRLHRIDVFPLNSVWNDPLVPTIVHLTVFGRGIQYYNFTTPATIVKAVTCAEVFKRMLPTNMFEKRPTAHPACARNVFVNSIKFLLKSSRIVNDIGTCNRDIYLRLCQYCDGNSAINLGVELGRMLYSDWPLNMENPDDNVLTPEASMRVVCFLARNAKPHYKVTYFFVVVHVFLSILKRGNVGRAVLDRTAREINARFAQNITLHGDLIKCLYEYFHYDINAEKVQIIKRRMENYFSALAERLLRTLIEYTKAGLLSYFRIREAHEKFSDFPWLRLYELLPNESKCYRAAVGVIGNNVWNSLRTDLGAFEAKSYCGLGYVAKHLLVNLAERTDMHIPKLGPSTPINNAIIDDLIRDYIKKRSTTPILEQQPTVDH